MLNLIEDKVIVQFNYNYTNCDGSIQQTRIPISIPCEYDDIESLVTKLLNQMDPIMRYLDENIRIRKDLESFIEQENQKYRDGCASLVIEKLLSNNIDVEEIIKETERNYKEEVLQFADRVGPSDDDIFAQSYHRLVHSSALEEILQKERDYSKVIAHMTELMDKEFEALNTSQQEELDSVINQLDITVISDDVNNLLAKQYSNQDYVHKRYESELEAKRGHQKNEFRNWITSQVSQLFQVSPISTPLGNRSSMFISQQPSMEESFTIHLGSQLKHMHNIRILSANINDLCSSLHANESFNGMNMALGLYSSSLCGVVVLTSSIHSQENKDIIKNANLSTEFHFKQIGDQLEVIEQQIRDHASSLSSASSMKSMSTISTDVSSIGDGTSSNTNTNIGTDTSTGSSPIKTNGKLRTGDFFITKHSNLSQSHVLFHLISNEPINACSEINSRHPVILGLRNILKTASRHDVTTITIPALLTHKMSEDMTVQWCIRRAELVFKCAKGFMIESASWGGAELSTLQLLLPHDISEELFNTLASMVPNVFRVSNPKILVHNKK